MVTKKQVECPDCRGKKIFNKAPCEFCGSTGKVIQVTQKIKRHYVKSYVPHRMLTVSMFTKSIPKNLKSKIK